MIAEQRAFRFDAKTHVYTDLETGRVIPHITQLLIASGIVDDTWFTEESSERGSIVHALTAQFDEGARSLKTVTVGVADMPTYQGYLLAHARALEMVRPTMVEIEFPLYSHRYGFAGRPDRVIETVEKARGKWEIKSVVDFPSEKGQKAHKVQTALQAILDSERTGIPPHAEARYAAYYRPNGRLRVIPHESRADFDEAYRIIKRYVA